MDCFKANYWNVMQLLGWVYLGDREFVRRASDGATDHDSIFRQLGLSDGCKEFVETPSEPRGLIGLSMLAEWNGGTAYPSYDDARKAVLSALREDKLHASGLENGEGNFKKIPANQWDKLDFYEDSNHCIYAVPDDRSRPGATKWHGLKFKCVEVLKIWPDPIKSRVKASPPQSLDTLEDATLDFKLKQDTWTVTEALFILYGCEPPVIETGKEFETHFSDAFLLAVNSIGSGTLCRESRFAGKTQYIDSPARWFAWALEKGLPVENSVRAGMIPAATCKSQGQEWPRGARSLEASDGRLLEHMRKMLDEGKANSVWAAAGKVVPDAAGAGTSDSKQKRLHRRYQKLMKNSQRFQR